MTQGANGEPVSSIGAQFQFIESISSICADDLEVTNKYEDN